MGIAEGGISGALLAAARDVDARLPADLRYPEAAVMRLAPNERLLPCRSVSCCWRWATSQLVNECTQARVENRHLRSILEEELGDSALQRLLEMQDSHAALYTKCQALQQELEAERHALDVTREELEAVCTARDEASANEVAAVNSRRACEAHVRELLDRIDALTGDLRSAQERTPEVLERKLAEKQARLDEASSAADEAEARHKKEIALMEEEKADLNYKLRVLRAHENKVVKQHTSARRKNKQHR